MPAACCLFFLWMIGPTRCESSTFDSSYFDQAQGHVRRGEEALARNAFYKYLACVQQGVVQGPIERTRAAQEWLDSHPLKKRSSPPWEEKEERVLTTALKKSENKRKSQRRLKQRQVTPEPTPPPRVNPKAVDEMIEVARAHESVGRLEESLRIYRLAATLRPDDESIKRRIRHLTEQIQS